MLGKKDKKTVKKYPVEKTDAEWREQLLEQDYQVLRQGKTEHPFKNHYYAHYDDGIYKCGGCGHPLFDSKTKFDSHSGWPSFYEPIEDKNIEKKTDYKMIIPRVEVICSNCGSHLGHVFNDGPNPTGKRYCINSAALDFVNNEQLAEDASAEPKVVSEKGA